MKTLYERRNKRGLKVVLSVWCIVAVLVGLLAVDYGVKAVGYRAESIDTGYKVNLQGSCLGVRG